MAVEVVSTGAFINQISGMQNKQLQNNNNIIEDANIEESLRNAQNIGNSNVRTIEETEEGDNGNAVNRDSGSGERGGEVGSLLDILV